MLKLKLDSLDDVPSDVAEHYRKVGEEYVLDISGVVTEAERDRLKGALDKEKNDHKESKSKLNAFSGLDAEQVLKDLDEMAELRIAAGTGDEDKKAEIESLVTARANALLAPVQRQLTQSQEDNVSLKETNKALTGDNVKRTISSELKNAAVKAKVVPTALDDINLYGESMFTISEHDGAVVTKEGLTGVASGLSPELFLIEMKDSRPHWFPDSVGSGAKGSGAGAGGGTNPWHKDHLNITAQGKMITADRGKAIKMAAAVGQNIDGSPA